MFSLSAIAVRRFSSVKLFSLVYIHSRNSHNIYNSSICTGAAVLTTINQRSFADNKKTTENVISQHEEKQQVTTMENKTDSRPINKEELKKRLTPLQYQVTQEAATERPFTGCYNKHYEKGIYQCIVCHQDLFSSDTKYDSGCGWPAFNDVLDKGKVTLHRDASIPVISKMLGMVRTEVRCSKCSAHMGHVFDDGPAPKNLRYCINSASIDFVKKTVPNNGQPKK